MAADKALVQGAFRYGMSMVPKDTTKISMMEGASITRSLVGGINEQIKKEKEKEQAKKANKRDLQKLGYNLAVVQGQGDEKFAKAGQEAFDAIGDYGSMSFTEQARIQAATKRGGEQGKDLATTITSFLQNPDAYKRIESSDGTLQDGTDAKIALLKDEDGYDIRYSKNFDLMIKFKGDADFVNWNEWKAEHLKENTTEADAKLVGDLRKEAKAAGDAGKDFNYANSKQRIIQGMFKDDIDINDFSNKPYFNIAADKNNPDGGLVDFKGVLMLNPDIQKAVIRNINNNPNSAKYDIDGIEGFNQADIDLAIKNENSGKIKKGMSEMVDALTNPRNPLYDRELAQDVLGDAIAREIKNSSYKKATPNNDGVKPGGTLAERREQNTLKSFASQVEDLKGGSDGKRRIELGDEGVLFINKNGEDYTLTREYYEGDAKQTSIEDLSIDQAFVKMSKSGLLAKDELSSVYSLFKDTEDRNGEGGAFAVDIMDKDDSDVKSDILANYSGVKVNKNISGINDAGVEVIEVVADNGARQVVYLQGENSTEKQKELKKLNNFLEKNAEKKVNTDYQD